MKEAKSGHDEKTQNRILGIDPGSRATGFGIIDVSPSKQEAVHFGVIHGNQNNFCQRLHHMFSNIRRIISEYQPDAVAIEQVFVHANVQSALKLGQARGALLVACADADLIPHEYHPRQIKQAIAGHGGAKKIQMQLMIRQHFQLNKTPAHDAADALAIALCHHYHARWNKRVEKI